MGTGNSTDDFKRDAAAQITERGYPATAFVAEHRGQFSIRAMHRCLRIQPSGFYAWLKVPLSGRAQENRRQTELLHKACTESGKVYGYRKLHDDLVEQGKSICPNRVSRLAQLTGIKAQIGYERRPGGYGGKPSAVIDIEPVNATGSRGLARP